MDFDAAIQAHTNWKLRLFSYATGASTEKLDAVSAGKDNVCALGQWLYGEGKTIMAGKAEYQELLRAHADFHRQAASLITMIERGQAEGAKAALSDRTSAYGQCSTKVVGLLMTVKSKIK